MTLFKTTIAAAKVLSAMYERSVFSYRGSNLRNWLNHECANWATQRRAVNDESFSINFFSSPVNSNCKCTGEGLVKKLSGSLVV